MFGTVLRDTVPPATAALAWPWLAQPGPMHRVALTRDSLCLAGDVEAPHTDMVEVPAEMGVAAIAEALLRSPWLAYVGHDATWWYQADATTLVFGLRAAYPFTKRIGENSACTAMVTDLHVRYAAQRDPDDLCREIAEHRETPSDENGTAQPPGD